MFFPWQVAVTLAAGSVMLALSCVAQTQRRLLIANPFSLACALAAGLCFLYAWQIQSSSLEEKLLLLKLAYSTTAFLPLISLEITYRFVYERRLFRGWVLMAGLVVPAITAVLAWTINSSTIFRYDFWLDTSGALPLLRFKEGPWSFLFYFYTYSFALWSFAILLGSLRTATPWARRARIIFVIAKLIPVTFDVLFHFKVLPPVGMNYAPASIALTDILICFVIFGDRIGSRAYVARSTLVEKISDLLVVLDHRRRVLDINHATARALGVRREAVQGQPVSTLFDSWRDVLAHLGDGPGAAVEIEREGKWFEMTMVPVEPESGGGMVTDLLWLRDVTRRKQAELGYVAAANAAREANTAKDRYLAVMSHEIRSPLNSVLGFMRLLETTPLDPEQKEYVDHIARSGDNLLVVVNEVLDFSKIEAGHMPLALGPFDLREEIENLCRGMKPDAAAKGLSFRWQIASDVPPILIGDQPRVGQILRNLIGNAIKFTFKGGVTVQVDCLRKSQTPPLCLVRLAVADTGIGIAAHEMETLFQPFAQATPSIQHQYGGTGLGLVIARRISELMGGTITVESVPKSGSTFACTLQLEIGERLVGSPSEASPAIATIPLRILIVDDQPTNRRLLQIMLTRMGHQVEVTPDGFACLQLLQHETFDVMLLDIEMPGIDGFEVCRQILEDGKSGAPSSMPVIIALTAHASTDIRERCFAAGMDGYLSKPVTSQALKEALELVASRPAG